MSNEMYKNKRAILINGGIALVAILLLFSVFTPIASAMNTQKAKNQVYVVPQTIVKGYSKMGLMNPQQKVTVIINIPLKNTGLLQSEVQLVSTPGSPMYHKFLTQKAIMNTFVDLNKFNQVKSILTQDGFTIQSTPMDSMIIATGTVQQLTQYLGLSVGIYSNGQQQYYSAYGTPTISGVNIYSSNISHLFFEHPSTFVNMNTINELKNKINSFPANSVSPKQIPPFTIEPYPTTSLQTVYNATGLYAKNITGKGATIGILDFAGEPYIVQDLQEYDQMYGLPAPPSLNIVPIGPYDPQMGISTGWAGETAMDVEASHTMAPGANITLYIANFDLPLAPVIAQIDSLNAVNTLSQSFSMSESYFSIYGPANLYYNVILTDQYYQIGALEGITFSASSGDTGGTGDSVGTYGAVGYPATSPYVTAVGGTTTYMTSSGSYQETAWSNYGFIPNQVNYGGSTGGVSIWEPKPWYQNVPTPSGYINGRMVPDVSLQASVFPGDVFVFPLTGPGIGGGTSEASPLFAGLIALAVQYTGKPVGLANPSLYYLGTSTNYSAIFHPITFGYNIPWTDHYGYNLVTGFGSLNIGAFATYLKQMESTKAPSTLTITVNAYNNTGVQTYQFLDGQTIYVAATILNGTANVTTGKFYASMETLNGYTKIVSLTYVSKSNTWNGTISISNGEVGLTNLIVNGSSSGIKGNESTSIFLGYLIQFGVYPLSPYNLQMGFSISGADYWILNDTQSTTNSATIFDLSTYSILANKYTLVNTTIPITTTSGSFSGLILGNYPVGVSILIGTNSYGFLPFINGDGLQNSLILGSLAIEPGSAAPGQTIAVGGSIQPSFDSNTMFGATINFTLVNSQGKYITSIECPNGVWQEMQVPSNVPSGLYTIFINSSYDSYSYSTWFNGSYFGQIYIAPSASNPAVKLSNTTLIEGNNLTVYANITYSNGKAVQYGMYGAVIYPSNLQSEFSLVSAYVTIPLYFDSTLNEWVGTAQLPSGNSSSFMQGLINGLPDYSGSYAVSVIGTSYDGVPTVINPAELTAYIQNPMVYNLQQQINGINSKLSSIQTQISQMNSAINGLNGNISVLRSNISALYSMLNTLSGELTSLMSTAKYLNTTYGLNDSQQQAEINKLNSEISNLTAQLNNVKTSTSSTTTTTNNNTSLSIAALVIAIIGLILGLLAFLRKPKTPTTVQTNTETTGLNDQNPPNQPLQ
ncbi:MAG: protease pro-enzyme activation domain-containing protein [Thermoplasmata archaeon]